MCEIIPEQNINGWATDDTFLFGLGEIEKSTILKEEDDIWFDSKFFDVGGKVFCKHPDTDWHEMEVQKGQSLHCPALTEIKVVLPKPFNFGMIR